MSIILTILILPAVLLPALTKARNRAQAISCANNLKQVGLAIKTRAVVNGNQFLFNVSTNSGGSLEFALPDPEGFDSDPAAHFRLLANEIGSPHVLVCPADKVVQPASSMATLQSGNISYRLRTGTNITELTPGEALVVCPIHHNVLRSDGSVHTERSSRER